MLKIKLKKLHTLATTPERQTSLSSGFDLFALDVVSHPNIKKDYDINSERFLVYPGDRVLVRTGIAIELGKGLDAQVRPRSGLALKNGVTVLNTPGTIDADYRGDIGVILTNLGNFPFPIRRGDRIAQLVISPVCHDLCFIESSLTDSERGDDGFGHTGK